MQGLDLDAKVLSLQFLSLKTFCISLIDLFTAYELIKGPKYFSSTAFFVLFNPIDGYSWLSEKKIYG